MDDDIDELKRQLVEAEYRIAELEQTNEELTRQQQSDINYVPGLTESGLTRRMLASCMVIKTKSIDSLGKKPINFCCEPLFPLEASILDEPLSSNEAEKLLVMTTDEEKMIIGKSCMYPCAVCKQVVLWMPEGPSAVDSWLRELRAIVLPCYRQAVCGECALRSVLHDLH